MENLIKQVQSMLTITPERWHSLTQTLPAELLLRKPAPSEWSAIECLQHMLDTERVFQFRMKCFLDGIDFPAFDPDSQGTKAGGQSPIELAAEFKALRTHSLQSIKTLIETDLDRRVHHQEFGPVSLREMLSEWAVHDLNHTVQAEQALMQPFLLECGPWIVYFKDHVIGEKS